MSVEEETPEDERLREAIDLLRLTGWLDEMLDEEDQERVERLAARKVKHGRN